MKAKESLEIIKQGGADDYILPILDVTDFGKANRFSTAKRIQIVKEFNESVSAFLRSADFNAKDRVPQESKGFPIAYFVDTIKRLVRHHALEGEESKAQKRARNTQRCRVKMHERGEKLDFKGKPALPKTVLVCELIEFLLFGRLKEGSNAVSLNRRDKPFMPKRHAYVTVSEWLKILQIEEGEIDELANNIKGNYRTYWPGQLPNLPKGKSWRDLPRK